MVLYNPLLAIRRCDDDPLPFPRSNARRIRNDASSSIEQAQFALENVSRRIEDLARELNCLGYFDDRGDNDRPRAA